MTSTKGAKLKGLTENRHEIPLLPTIEHIEFPLKRISYSRYAENIRMLVRKLASNSPHTTLSIRLHIDEA